MCKIGKAKFGMAPGRFWEELWHELWYQIWTESWKALAGVALRKSRSASQFSVTPERDDVQ